MRILVSGASGFVGAPLVSKLLELGHSVTSLDRHSKEKRDSIFWNPSEKIIVNEELEGFDAVIHLAGEPVASGLWTSAKRQKIFNSRVLSTQFLCNTLQHLRKPPKVFISASAIGFYGDRKEELVTEESSKGSGFLSHVCHEWEKASLDLEARGVRVVHLRFGHVLGPHGGMLSKMIPLYRLGLGARLGSGEQWMSWVALSDLLSAIDFTLHHELTGPVNLVSPHPVRQLVFSKKLADFLHRPHYLVIPAWVLKFFGGDMADELFLSSARVYPQKLLEASFHFKYENLEDALCLSLTQSR